MRSGSSCRREEPEAPRASGASPKSGASTRVLLSLSRRNRDVGVIGHRRGGEEVKCREFPKYEHINTFPSYSSPTHLRVKHQLSVVMIEIIAHCRENDINAIINYHVPSAANGVMIEVTFLSEAINLYGFNG